MIPGGQLLGSRLRIGWSWPLLAPVIGLALFAGTPVASGFAWARAVVAAAGTAALFASVVLHEAGHLVAARLARVGCGEVRVFFLGGHVEYDLDAAPPGAEVVVATSGPAVSVALALVAAGLAALLPDEAGSDRVLGVVAGVDLAVAAVALLPVVPFDGGHLVRGVLRATGWRPAVVDRVAGLVAGAAALALVVTGFVATGAGEVTGLALAPAGVLVLALVPRSMRFRTGTVADVMQPVGQPIGEADPVPVGGPPRPVVRGTRVVGVVFPGAAGLAGEAMVAVAAGDVVAADAAESALAGREDRVVLVVAHGVLAGLVPVRGGAPVPGTPPPTTV